MNGEVELFVGQFSVVAGSDDQSDRNILSICICTRYRCSFDSQTCYADTFVMFTDGIFFTTEVVGSSRKSASDFYLLQVLMGLIG